MPSSERGITGRIRQLGNSAVPTGAERTGHADRQPATHEPVYLAHSDRMVLLDRSDARYQVQRLMIDVLQRVNAAAYFDVGVDDVVRRVLVPRLGRVLKLDPTADEHELRVHFEGSAARLKTRTETDDERRHTTLLNESRLRGTLLEVTFDPDSNDIIDVQRSAEAAPVPAPPSVTVGVKAIEQLPVTTPDKAAHAFAQLAERSCDPSQPAAGCIPFQFVGDGCWMRAHQMCGFLSTQGIAAGKVWIYGDLHIATRFTSSCAQDWNFHAAAFVRTTGDRVLVYDPSLFISPVSVDEWMLEMNDSRAEIEFSAAPIYVMAERGNARLEMTGEFARERASFVLELMNLDAAGPLPFAHCPV